MKKILVATLITIMMASSAYAMDGRGGIGSGSAAGAIAEAGAAINQNFQATKVPPGVPDYPILPGTQLQQQIQPSGRDKHFNRTIKPWAIKKCFTLKDLARIENQFGFGNSIVNAKGTVQIFPFEDYKGSINAFTVIEPLKYEDAVEVYDVIAAGIVFASDSETTYMQEWVKLMKANLKEIGTPYVMIWDEGAKEGAEANGWNFGLSVGVGVNGLAQGGDRVVNMGATAGFGIANSQTVAQEYPHLTIIFLDAKKK
mgnify:CR=1 FL=1